jgi:cellulose synthase/poly-beta-1,6-N-acetylglucosamine synthase-like glycosyltransferase
MTAWFWIFVISLAVLAYAHVAYPALCGLLGVGRYCSPRAPTRWPRVTLVIPAHNEAVVLRAKLQNALAIDYPAELLEIIVANDGSSDATAQIAREFASGGVQQLDFSQRRGKASVVNDAVARAAGQILCLCDANVMFRPDALRLLVARLEDPTLGAVTADVRLASNESNFGQGESLYYRVERALQLGESRIGSLMGVDGGMYVLRRELYRPLPPDTILDDFVISMHVVKAGYRVAYEPAAVADENGTPLAIQEFRRRVRVAAGAVQVLKRGDFPGWRQPVAFWQFVSHKLLRWMGPAWLAMLLISNAALAFQAPSFAWFLGAQLAFYAVAVAAAAWLPMRRTKPGGIAFYFAMSHAAMVVGTVKGMLNRQRVTWKQAARAAGSERAPSQALNAS